jgi:tetratricopeptide (TPR) repeat protein
MARHESGLIDSGFLAAAFKSAAAIGGLLAGLGLLASGLFGWKELPAPFAWTDVAIVQLLASLPLAALAAAAIRTQFGAAICLVVGIAALIAAGWIGLIGFWREAILLGAAVGLVAVALGAQKLAVQRQLQLPNLLAVTLVSFLVMLGVPWIYVEARRSHDDRELGELLDQSRVGEAQHLAVQSLILDPRRKFRGQPLRDVAAELNGVVRDLESSVALPLSADASLEARLARARDLAMLGRTAAALQVLAQPASLAESPDGLMLRGTIHQARQEFLPSGAAFREAAEQLNALPPSPDRASALVTAYSGIAFAARKLGNNAEAVTAYQQVLVLDPSADTHFLLAQFYEGTQQAALAQKHARQAMALAPERFEVPAQRLIDKLVTHHFGCWGAAAAERRSE